MGVKGVLSAENLHAEHVLFEVACSPSQGLGHREAQEVPMSRRVAELLARKNLVQHELN
jgi:hypothetical protein